jgi:hypothetical protein
MLLVASHHLTSADGGGGAGAAVCFSTGACSLSYNT